jgi:hypothetical protein
MDRDSKRRRVQSSTRQEGKRVAFAALPRDPTEDDIAAFVQALTASMQGEVHREQRPPKRRAAQPSSKH